MKGAGTITGEMSNGGTVAPGLSPGILNVVGNYSQTAGNSGHRVERHDRRHTVRPAQRHRDDRAGRHARDHDRVLAGRGRLLRHCRQRRCGRRRRRLHRCPDRRRPRRRGAPSASPTWACRATTSSSSPVPWPALRRSPCATRPSGAGSDGNTVFEPGETVLVRPSWEERRYGPELSLTGSGLRLHRASPARATRSPMTTPRYGSVRGRRHGRLRRRLLFPLRDRARRRARRRIGTRLFTETPRTHRPAEGLDPPRRRQLQRRAADPALLQAHRDARPHRDHVGLRRRRYCPGRPGQPLADGDLHREGHRGRRRRVPEPGPPRQPLRLRSGGTSLFTDVTPTDIFCQSTSTPWPFRT